MIRNPWTCDTNAYTPNSVTTIWYLRVDPKPQDRFMPNFGRWSNPVMPNTGEWWWQIVSYLNFLHIRTVTSRTEVKTPKWSDMIPACRPQTMSQRIPNSDGNLHNEILGSGSQASDKQRGNKNPATKYHTWCGTFQHVLIFRLLVVCVSAAWP